MNLSMRGGRFPEKDFLVLMAIATAAFVVLKIWAGMR